MEHDRNLVVDCFNCNFIKLNKAECHFLICGHRTAPIWVRLESTNMWESGKQELFIMFTARARKIYFFLKKIERKKLSIKQGHQVS